MTFPDLNRPLSIGLLTPHNPFDRRKFSGTPFFAARALDRHPALRLRILGGHRPPGAMDRWLRRRLPDLTPADAIDVSGLDAVVGLVASPLLAALADRHPRLPYLHVTDATPAFLRDIYGWNVPGEADATEARVVARALASVYSSDVMAARAPADLGLSRPAVESAPFGINLETRPPICPEKPPLRQLNLLFVGLDWVRKGGDIAVAALDELRAMGRDARLTIVGRCPAAQIAHPAITYAGFLDKNRPAHAAALARLYTQAHVMLLPSRGDCTPMVIGEAMAHGTPVIATDTGGVASLLGGTGLVMPPFAPPRDWARAIATLCDDEYTARSQDSFARAEQVLSWDRWADRITETLLERLTLSGPETRKAA